MISHMTEAHPAVKNIRVRIADAEQKIKHTPAEIVLHQVYGSATDPDPLAAERVAALAAQWASTESELEAGRSDMQRLESRLTRLQKLMANFVPLRQEYLAIIDRIAWEEAEFQRWRGPLMEVEMALAAEVARRRTHLTVVQRADRKVVPDEPRLTPVLAVALCLSLVVIVVMELVALVLRRRRRTGPPRFRPWSRLLVTVALVVLLAAVGLAVYSNVLRLHHPAMYEQWRESPVQFIRQQLSPPWPSASRSPFFSPPSEVRKDRNSGSPGREASPLPTILEEACSARRASSA